MLIAFIDPSVVMIIVYNFVTLPGSDSWPFSLSAMLVLLLFILHFFSFFRYEHAI